MKQFFFVIRENMIGYIDFGVKAPIAEYYQYCDIAVKEKVDYKITNGEVSSIICEAECITSAISAVEKFLCYQRVYKVA